MFEPGVINAIVVVEHPKGVGHPAGVGLGEVDAELGETIEQARVDELREAERGDHGADALRHRRGDTRAAGALGRAAEVGLAIAEVGVRRQPHLDVHGRLPEPVVLGFGPAAAVGENVERDRPQAYLFTAFQLRDGVVDARHRHHAGGDEPVRRNGAVVLGEERVVGLDHGEVDLAVLDSLEKPGGEDRREQHLAVDAVLVLLPQALSGVPGAGGTAPVVVEVGAASEAHRLPRRDVLPIVEHRHPFDDPALSAFGQLDEPRRSLLPFLRHVLDPYVRWSFHVAVGRNHLIFSLHVVLSSHLTVTKEARWPRTVSTPNAPARSASKG